MMYRPQPILIIVLSLSLATLPAAILGQCANDYFCAECKTPSECTKCYEGYGVVNGICEKCSGERCSVCNGGKCSECSGGFDDDNFDVYSGYNVTSSGACVKCPAECLSCSGDAPDKCLECNSRRGLTPSGKCERCADSACTSCSQDATKCTKCDDAFGLVQGKCQQCKDKNCNVCDGNVNLCAKCSEYGYGRTSAKTCKPCIDKNCSVCDSTLKRCIQCDYDYETGENYGTNPAGLCIRCSDKNCLECSTSKQCLKCYPYYHLKSGKCLPCGNKFCSSCPVQRNVCESCRDPEGDGYYGLTPAKTCSKCPANCGDCTFANKCYEKGCYNGYGVLPSGQCGKCKVANCQNCDLDLSKCTDT